MKMDRMTEISVSKGADKMAEKMFGSLATLRALFVRYSFFDDDNILHS